MWCCYVTVASFLIRTALRIPKNRWANTYICAHQRLPTLVGSIKLSTSCHMDLFKIHLSLEHAKKNLVQLQIIPQKGPKRRHTPGCSGTPDGRCYFGVWREVRQTRYPSRVLTQLTYIGGDRQEGLGRGIKAPLGRFWHFEGATSCTQHFPPRT